MGKINTTREQCFCSSIGTLIENVMPIAVIGYLLSVVRVCSDRQGVRGMNESFSLSA